jgi:hypothetical protein
MCPQVPLATPPPGLDTLHRKHHKHLPLATEFIKNHIQAFFYSVAYPAGWCVLDFSKFDGEGSRTMWEHVSEYLAQLG